MATNEPNRDGVNEADKNVVTDSIYFAPSNVVRQQVQAMQAAVNFSALESELQGMGLQFSLAEEDLPDANIFGYNLNRTGYAGDTNSTMFGVIDLGTGTSAQNEDEDVGLLMVGVKGFDERNQPQFLVMQELVQKPRVVTDPSQVQVLAAFATLDSPGELTAFSPSIQSTIWSRFTGCVQRDCISTCLGALSTCSGNWAAYLGCVATKCGGCALKCGACAGCNCGFWCKWAAGCCS